MVTTVEFKPLMQDRILVQLQMASEIAPPEEGEAEEKKEEAQDASPELPVVEESKAEESIDRPAP